jgi:flagellar biosynthetic protein FlhB
MGGWMLWSITRRRSGWSRRTCNGAVGSLGGQFLTLMFVMAGGLLLIAGIDLPIQIIRH